MAAALLLLRQWKGTLSCGEISDVISQWGIIAPLVFIVLYILATILFVPGTIFGVSAGVMFGPWLGTLYGSVGSVLGAIAAFFFARYFARDYVEKKLTKQPWFEKFKTEFEKNSISYLMFLRLSPVFPFNGLNYAIGLLPIRTRDYVLTSIFGMLPGTIAYVYAGYAFGCAALDRGAFDSQARAKVFIALIALSALSFLPILFRKIRQNR